MPTATTVKVQLDPRGVTRPALIAMRDSLEMIAISLDALEKADLTQIPEIPGCFFNFNFKRPENEDPHERKAALTRWLLTKGFQELVRGIRESLEEAYAYASVGRMHGVRTTYEQFLASLAQSKKEAAKADFPTLMRLVNEGLKAPLSFEAEFLSLQRVRNCMEHRAGFVGSIDSKGDEALRLVLPILKVYLLHDGGETEVQFDMGESRRVEAGQTVEFRRGSRERVYKLGERIQIDAADYQEITHACWIFVSDLAAKLPPVGGETLSTPTPGQISNP